MRKSRTPNPEMERRQRESEARFSARMNAERSRLDGLSNPIAGLPLPRGAAEEPQNRRVPPPVVFTPPLGFLTPQPRVPQLEGKAIITQEQTFQVDPRFDSVFRRACCDHPTYPTEPSFLTLINPLLAQNARRQPIKGYSIIDPQYGTPTAQAVIGDGEGTPIPRDISPQCNAFCNAVRDMVLGLETAHHVTFTRYSFDLQVRHANTVAGLRDTDRDGYHYDNWGAWTPWGGTGRPRFVICIYWQNFHPHGALLQVRKITEPTGEAFMGDVKYVGNGNWPIKIAILDQRECMHRPSIPSDDYPERVHAEHPGDNWRVLLRIHADTAPGFAGGRVTAMNPLHNFIHSNNLTKKESPKNNVKSSKNHRKNRSHSSKNRSNNLSHSSKNRSKSMNSLSILQNKKVLNFKIKEDKRVPKFTEDNVFIINKKNKKKFKDWFPKEKIHWLV
jgi:hypothetical protein